MIPESLKIFLNVSIKTGKKEKEKKEETEKWDNVIKTFAHCLISAVQPRSFLSPIIFGLSVVLHRKHGSKMLVDLLSNLGLCASYKQICLFEASIVINTKKPDLINSYLQFSFELERLPSASEIGKHGYWDLLTFKKPLNSEGLNKVAVQKLNLTSNL